MIKYTFQDILKYKNNYIINDKIIDDIKKCKKLILQSTHVSLNYKIDNNNNENIKNVIIFLNKLSFDNFDNIIDEINIIINKEQDLLDIISNLMNKIMIDHKITIQNVEKSNIILYSKLIRHIILNKYKWICNGNTFRYYLLQKLCEIYSKIEELDKKLVISLLIFLSSLYKNNILSNHHINQIILESNMKNESIIEGLIFMSNILDDKNKKQIIDKLKSNDNLSNRHKILLNILIETYLKIS